MWLKVDHNLLDHDKWEILEDDQARWCRAVAVWVACGTMCSRLQTDGLIRVSRVRRLCPMDASDVQAGLDDLVRAGFIVNKNGALWMHNFLQYNPSKDELDEKRARRSETQKRYRSKTTERQSLDSRETVSPESKDTPPIRTDPYRSVPIRTDQTPAPVVADTQEPIMESQNLRMELKRVGKNQSDLAQSVLGATRTLVKGWCSGDICPSDDEQAQINKALTLFRKQHAGKVQVNKSEAKVYQDSLCQGFDELFAAKYGCPPSWSGKQYAAIKRLRAAGRSVQLVLDKAAIMFSWHGVKFPCKDSCDFMTLCGHFDLFSVAKVPQRQMTYAARDRARKAREEQEANQ